jgi:hypothetical protein
MYFCIIVLHRSSARVTRAQDLCWVLYVLLRVLCLQHEAEVRNMGISGSSGV